MRLAGKHLFVVDGSSGIGLERARLTADLIGLRSILENRLLGVAHVVDDRAIAKENR